MRGSGGGRQGGLRASAIKKKSGARGGAFVIERGRGKLEELTVA